MYSKKVYGHSEIIRYPESELQREFNREFREEVGENCYNYLTEKIGNALEKSLLKASSDLERIGYRYEPVLKPLVKAIQTERGARS